MVHDVLMAGNMSEETALTNRFSKRKSIDKRQSSAKAKKMLEVLSDNDEECEWTPSQEDKVTSYPLEEIKKFLLDT